MLNLWISHPPPQGAGTAVYQPLGKTTKVSLQQSLACALQELRDKNDELQMELEKLRSQLQEDGHCQSWCRMRDSKAAGQLQPTGKRTMLQARAKVGGLPCLAEWVMEISLVNARAGAVGCILWGRAKSSCKDGPCHTARTSCPSWSICWELCTEQGENGSDGAFSCFFQYQSHIQHYSSRAPCFFLPFVLLNEIKSQ